ncbi:alanine acetyltransferase [Roseivivax halodurans JCM 10272]|uniref:Alanine acetyltransferase n=1 Tax=Roseivivax halodurans JCM 10272 TaxID=1449350 RepID=X7EGX4_9RHOB|nr:GNAT family N-acetyltransferase [Roseivivax halodurans]ETX15187.1 alanine acetyltransferase [Roseivivax halodurans JCM 10272]
MTPEAMAGLMARAYEHQTPWRASDIEDLAGRKVTRIYTAENGFLIAQVIADEAEILALAVDPSAQRQGIASRLLGDFHADTWSGGVVRTVLDVAEDNLSARALYTRHGYEETARRAGYYPRRDGPAAAALLMSRTMTKGHNGS